LLKVHLLADWNSVEFRKIELSPRRRIPVKNLSRSLKQHLKTLNLMNLPRTSSSNLSQNPPKVQRFFHDNGIASLRKSSSTYFPIITTDLHRTTLEREETLKHRNIETIIVISFSPSRKICLSLSETFRN
jgi:hypothetical protein